MLVRYLNEASGAIAGTRIRSNRTAVGEILQNLQTLENNLVTLSVLYVCYEADPASVMLITRVVEPLFFG